MASCFSSGRNRWRRTGRPAAAAPHAWLHPGKTGRAARDGLLLQLRTPRCIRAKPAAPSEMTSCCNSAAWLHPGETGGAEQNDQLLQLRTPGCIRAKPAAPVGRSIVSGPVYTVKYIIFCLYSLRNKSLISLKLIFFLLSIIKRQNPIKSINFVYDFIFFHSHPQLMQPAMTARLSGDGSHP